VFRGVIVEADGYLPGQVSEGPHYGSYEVPFVTVTPADDYPVGTKFHLEQPVAWIERRMAKGDEFFAEHEVLRDWKREEPWFPPVVPRTAEASPSEP
jgi:hypothetical protein